MVKATSLFLLLFSQAAFACQPHPNLVLCWEMQEGENLKVNDESGLGLKGTLTGGPAWVRASDPQYIGHRTSSNTFTNMGIQAVSFPGTGGVKVVTGNTSAFDFSSNKPYMYGITIQAPSTTLAANSTIVSFNDNTNGTGWSMHMNTDGALIHCHVGVANSPAGAPIGDTNPHRIFVCRRGGLVAIYLDAVRYKINTGFSDMAAPAGAQPFGVALESLSAAGVWPGKANGVVIYNDSPLNLEGMDAFAYNDWLRYQPGITRWTPTKNQ